MKRKINLIVICTLLIVLAIPSSIGNAQSLNKTGEDIEIEIFAGLRGKDTGFGIGVNIFNHKTETIYVFVNVTLDYLIKNCYDGTFGWVETVEPESDFFRHFYPIIVPDGLKFISITAEVEDTIVTRSGFSIFRFVIFN